MVLISKHTFYATPAVKCNKKRGKVVKFKIKFNKFMPFCRCAKLKMLS